MTKLQADEPLAPKQVVALVDDEVQIAQALQALLSFKGVSSSVHHSAESLLQALVVADGELYLKGEDGVPALLGAAVLDLNLPGMNGADLVVALRRLQPRLQIVMITAALDGKLQERAQDLQGVTVLSKPFTLESLESALQVA